MKKQIVGLVVLLALILTVIVWQMPRETVKIDKIKSRDVRASTSVTDEFIAPVVAVSQPPEDGALVLEVPPALTVTEVTQEEGNEELIKSAPEWLRNKLRDEGFPSLPMSDSDPYQVVVFISPNDGSLKVQKVASATPLVADDGTRYGYAISYMKGQKPLIAVDNDRILVGPIVYPGGDK